MENKKTGNRLSNDVRITNRKRRPGHWLLYGVIIAVSALIVAMVVYFILYILSKGASAISWEFLSTATNPIKKTNGILPSIVNTLYIVAFTLLLCVPIGIGGAIYLNEYAKNQKFVRTIEFAAETLSGIPSIIYGVFGYLAFCELLGLKYSLLAGILTLTIIVLPIIIRTTQEALRAVPRTYRDGSLAMGSTKWYMVRTILLPSSLKGILTGIILATGRMVGESAAMLMVSGMDGMYMPEGNLWEQLHKGGSTLSVELYRHATSRGDNQTAFGIAAVLLTIVIILNLLTRYIAGKLGKK